VAGAILIVIGIAAFIGAFDYASYAYEQAVITQSQWPTVMGTIQSSKLEERDDSEVFLVVEFEYQVEAMRYSGKQEWYVATKQLGLPQQQDYWSGRMMPVYYNPKNPAKAVVNTAQVNEVPRIFYYLLYFGGPILFILGLVVIAYRRKPKVATA
jgi:hypothetical protein